MNALLLNREAGISLPGDLRRTCNHRLLQAIQPSSTRFEPTAAKRDQEEQLEELLEQRFPVAHHGGVNSIAIDRFEGRYLLSGGADASISIWDLETTEPNNTSATLHRPLATAPRGVSPHTHGITQISFFPFDSLAFLSSSYDHSLKIGSTETLQVSATFNLESVVYAHATSNIASHLLVACATQHPAVRLVDLRSGAASHALAGHTGALLTVAWSPVDEHVLASGGADGTVRFWDIRKSAGFLGSMDMEDSVGIIGYNGLGLGARRRERGKAHVGPVNGIVWSEDGRHIVSTGHDERIRVWNTIAGANTLANFGPLLKNRHLSRLLPCLAPSSLTLGGKDVLFFPSEKEILMFETFEGRLVKRLRTPGLSSSGTAGNEKVDFKQRIVDLAWRAHNVELYSAHGDGSIRAWKPRTTEDALADEEEAEEREAEEIDRKRKRQALENVYQDLARKRVMF
ncbi:wd40 repeat-like protein [Venturia nashicola]|uniref:Wd40 repeat-like protein n=1 Tax=Venturia nashicola TaxID=86259 RepID=A0A4Z1PF25_9PEZI|nr:wd40 repeat-like protein [Venturia nashicola]